jgi:large subunit ribosomal protein L10
VPSQRKIDLVAQYAERLGRSKSVVVADYRGLTVAEVNALRALMRKASIEYRVAKNRLFKKAAAECGFEPLDEALQGPSAFAFGYEDAVLPAKVLSEFAGKTEKLKIKGGWLGKRALSAQTVIRLAKLPSREQMLGRLIGSLRSPAARVAISLRQAVSKLAYALKAVADSVAAKT